MLFNSVEFLLFLVFTFIFYWFVFANNLKIQNLFLIAVSYLFYGWWDWRFLGLIIFSSGVDFALGLTMEKPRFSERKKWILAASLITNLGILGVFKYYDFFIYSFESLLEKLGLQANILTLKLLLPVGISFYTFQTLSYAIDVYRGKIKASHDPISFFAFVSFFPQLVAGPIERASSLLSQFKVKRIFKYQQSVIGLRLMLWGFFKKMVIADNCAIWVNDIFDNYQNHSGLMLFFGAILFSFQIYGDFSGYSDIARGTAKLFGFNLMVNFRTPYFSRDIAEFWRRWHISLSTWFRDYLYIPLGGSKAGKWMSIRNVFIIFIVSGLWHGANWTFIAWGAIHAMLFLPLLIRSRNRKFTDVVAAKGMIPTVKELVSMASTFLLVSISWVFFRAESLGQAFDYLSRMVLEFSFSEWNKIIYDKIIVLLFIFLIVEWFLRKSEYLFHLNSSNKVLRWTAYSTIGILILLFAPKEANKFIYFQF